MRFETENTATGQACFIDIQKIFETLDHSILLEKLERYGYRGPTPAKIKAYLSDRVQHVFINRIGIDNKQMLTGVPQGSILGLFLFWLYINDLDTSSGANEVIMLADDTTLRNAGLTSAFSVQRIMIPVSDWLAASKLTIIADKCEMMFCGFGNPKLLKINDMSLKFKLSSKYLGVHLDKWLRFNQHIDYVGNNFNKFRGLKYSCRPLYPRKYLLLIYHAFAKSIISYGLPIYGSAAKTSL